MSMHGHRKPAAERVRDAALIQFADEHFQFMVKSEHGNSLNIGKEKQNKTSRNQTAHKVNTNSG